MYKNSVPSSQNHDLCQLHSPAVSVFMVTVTPKARFKTTEK